MIFKNHDQNQLTFFEKTLFLNEFHVLLNQCVVTCEKMIWRIFLGSFTHKMGIITPIFNNKNEVVQVVNSNMKLLKIFDNTND